MCWQVEVGDGPDRRRRYGLVLGLKQLEMRGTFVRLGSALRVIQSEVSRRYDFADYLSGRGPRCCAVFIDDGLHTAQKTLALASGKRVRYDKGISAFKFDIFVPKIIRVAYWQKYSYIRG